MACAVIVKGGFQQNLSEMDPREIGDPNQVVVETRHSLPWHKEIAVRRGKQLLFKLPNRFQWKSGALKQRVFECLGRPTLEARIMDEDYLIWKVDARYDWDFEDKFKANYMAISFRYNDRIESVTLTGETPPNAVPVPADHEFTFNVDEDY